VLEKNLCALFMGAWGTSYRGRRFMLRQAQHERVFPVVV